jgi:hypothetical protein
MEGDPKPSSHQYLADFSLLNSDMRRGGYPVSKVLHFDRRMELSMKIWRKRRVIIAATVLAVTTLAPGLFATASTASIAQTKNPNPCSYLSAKQVDNALGERKVPTVTRTTGGIPGDPVLVCTYAWGAANLIVRLISSATESESGGLKEPGMGRDGLLIAASTYTQVAFIKDGWSVWLVAKPAVSTHGLVVLGQSVYPKVRA